MTKIIGLAVFVSLIMGGCIGYFIRSAVLNDTSSGMQYITSNQNYPFISQRLDSESVNETTQGEVLTMKSQITKYIQDITNDGKVTKVAVYYRDLNNGPWMGLMRKTSLLRPAY